MINNRGTLFEVSKMSKTKRTPDFWEEIIDSLVLETEPPVRYIKDAVIVTKDGSKYKLSAAAFADLLAKEKGIPPEQSEIQHCSLSIDFNRIKKDMNKWVVGLFNDIEGRPDVVTPKTKAKKIAPSVAPKKIAPSVSKLSNKKTVSTKKTKR